MCGKIKELLLNAGQLSPQKAKSGNPGPLLSGSSQGCPTTLLQFANLDPSGSGPRIDPIDSAVLISLRAFPFSTFQLSEAASGGWKVSTPSQQKIVDVTRRIYYQDQRQTVKKAERKNKETDEKVEQFSLCLREFILAWGMPRTPDFSAFSAEAFVYISGEIPCMKSFWTLQDVLVGNRTWWHVPVLSHCGTSVSCLFDAIVFLRMRELMGFRTAFMEDICFVRT